MGHLFYLIGIFVFLSLLSNLFNLSKYYKIRFWMNTFKKVTSKDPQTSDFRDGKDQDIVSVYTSFSVFQFFWYLIGITSASWYIFGIIIILNFLVNLIVFNLPQSLIGRTILHTLLSTKILVVLALILNHFHFHYDWLLLLNH
jgi:hypothetical protein